MHIFIDLSFSLLCVSHPPSIGSEEEIYARCQSIVAEVGRWWAIDRCVFTHALLPQVNDLIATFTASPAEPIVLNPLNGSVVFASGKSQWGFSKRHSRAPCDARQLTILSITILLQHYPSSLHATPPMTAR